MSGRGIGTNGIVPILFQSRPSIQGNDDPILQMFSNAMIQISPADPSNLPSLEKKFANVGKPNPFEVLLERRSKKSAWIFHDKLSIWFWNGHGKSRGEFRHITRSIELTSATLIIVGREKVWWGEKGRIEYCTEWGAEKERKSFPRIYLGWLLLFDLVRIFDLYRVSFSCTHLNCSSNISTIFHLDRSRTYRNIILWCFSFHWCKMDDSETSLQCLVCTMAISSTRFGMDVCRYGQCSTTLSSD